MIKNTTARSIPMKQQKVFKEAFHVALKFIIEKYGNLNWDVEIKLSNTCRFSKHAYWRKRDRPCIIRINGRRRKWYSYNRKTVGAMANGIPISQKTAYTLSLIHELTHHVQYLQERQFSEVETTRNEIEFVSINHPDIFNKLTKV